MSPAFIMRTSEPYQLPAMGISHPNNLRYSLPQRPYPTGYHRVYVIYTAIMYRQTSFIFPAHRTTVDGDRRSRSRPEADYTDHTTRKRHRTWTPLGDVDDYTADTCPRILFRQRVHPAILGRHLPRGPFTYQQLADAFLHRQDFLDPRACPHSLAAMDNPYDEQARGTLGMQTGDPSRWDWAFSPWPVLLLFRPAAALLLFAPFKALTGTDLPTAVGCAFLAIMACASLIFLIETTVEALSAWHPQLARWSSSAPQS